MPRCKFIRVAAFLSCIFALGTFNAIAIGTEAANYKLLENIERLNVDGVREALSRGADPNARDPKPAHFKAIQLLMIRLVRDKNEDKKERVFHIAKLLLDHGAKIGGSENDILFSPIAEGHLQLVKLLLDNGASPFINIEGESPMEWAVYYQQDNIANLLEKYGVHKVSTRDEAQIKLMKAIADSTINYGLNKISDALLSGARINESDSSGRTPLIQALRFPVYRIEQVLVIRYLLNQGADPNMSGESGFRDLDGIPIHIAVVMNTLSMNKPDNNSDKIAIEVLRELIKHGARVSAMDRRGRTPLHLASKKDNVMAAQLLLESGCRVMAKDSLGKTPLDYAESKEMISLLKRHGAKESE